MTLLKITWSNDQFCLQIVHKQNIKQTQVAFSVANHCGKSAYTNWIEN